MNIHQLETGLVDADSSGSNTGIRWSYITRAWSSPTDSVLENLQIEAIGSFTVAGIVDNSSANTILNANYGAKQWIPAALRGTIADSVAFEFIGTQSDAQQEIYEIVWDLIPQTAKVTFYRTDYYNIRSFNQSQYNTENAEGWWHIAYFDVDTFGTSTITATVIVDAVTIGTFVIPAGIPGRTIYPFALPSEIYGKTIYTVYNSSTLFKYYNTGYHATVEPPRILFWETPATAVPSENYVKTWLPELNLCGGTCTASIYIDGTVILTTNLSWQVFGTGSDSPNRHIFELGLPNVTTAKNVKATYTSSTPFKHYDTKYELEAKPFGKVTHLVTYKKAGGASQADMARFYAMDIEGSNTQTLQVLGLLMGLCSRQIRWYSARVKTTVSRGMWGSRMRI